MKLALRQNKALSEQANACSSPDKNISDKSFCTSCGAPITSLVDEHLQPADRIGGSIQTEEASLSPSRAQSGPG